MYFFHLVLSFFAKPNFIVYDEWFDNDFKKTKGTFANMIIDQYKNSKNLFIISFFPNKIYCLAGYWSASL